MQKMGLEHARVFPLVVLKDITDNFSEEHVIGRGGSGVVYKGVLDSGEEIAVKKLYNRYDSSGNKLGNGEAQFLNELMNLIGVQHQHIIRLVGYCYETHNIVIECDGKRVLASEEERVLCLEYMQGGSLKDHLSDESCRLEWHTRYNIIKGVCEGVKYLHTGSENPIYHLDLKPENIWLDRNMIPKIGDFGIARLPAGSMQTYATENAVSGTIGYMAPEYIGRNQISQKCDVYSLGFIMIRVIAGEKGPQNYDPHRPSEEFIERVHENWGKRRKATMSSHLLQQVKTCTEVALRCVEFDREKRPTITDIVDELNKIDAAESLAIGGGQNAEEEEHITLENQPSIQEQKETSTEHLEEKMKDQLNDSCSTGKNLQTPVTMDLPKASGVNSAILSPPSLWTGSKEKHLQASFTSPVFAGFEEFFPGPLDDPRISPQARLLRRYFRVCSRPIPENPPPKPTQPVYSHTRASPRVSSRKKQARAVEDGGGGADRRRRRGRRPRDDSDVYLLQLRQGILAGLQDDSEGKARG